MLTTAIDGTYGLRAFGKQPVCVLAYYGPPTAGPSTVLVSLLPNCPPVSWPHLLAPSSPHPWSRHFRGVCSISDRDAIAYRHHQHPYPPPLRTSTPTTVDPEHTISRLQRKRWAASGCIKLPLVRVEPESRPSPPSPIHCLLATRVSESSLG